VRERRTHSTQPIPEKEKREKLNTVHSSFDSVFVRPSAINPSRCSLETRCSTFCTLPSAPISAAPTGPMLVDSRGAAVDEDDELRGAAAAAAPEDFLGVGFLSLETRRAACRKMNVRTIPRKGWISGKHRVEIVNTERQFRLLVGLSSPPLHPKRGSKDRCATTSPKGKATEK